MLCTVGLVSAGAVATPGVRAPLAALLAVFAYSVTLLPPAGRVLDYLARLLVAPVLALSGLNWLRDATDNDPAWELVGIAAAILIQVYIVMGMALHQQSFSDKDHDHEADTANHDGPSL